MLNPHLDGLYTPDVSFKRTNIVFQCLGGVAIFLIAAAIAHGHFKSVGARDFNERNYTGWYAPSALYAAGHGWQNVALDRAPVLNEFLLGQTETLDAARLDPPATMNWTAYQTCHRYLVYSVGLVWRLFGISWESIEWYQTAVFALSALLLYALLLAGMNFLFAGAATLAFLMLPTVLLYTVAIRDFSKVPFLLLTLAVVMHLFARKTRPLTLVALMLGLGALLGIGLGFRQDAVTYLPIALLGALAAPLAAQDPFAKRAAIRAGAALALLVAFFTVASPILMAMEQTGRSTSWQILCGLSVEPEHNLGLRPASYEKMYLYCDSLPNAVAVSHYRRNLGDTGSDYMPFAPPMTRMRDACLLDYARTFPYDLFVRGLQGTVHSLTFPVPPKEVNEQPFAPAYHYGLYTAAAAILLLAAWNLPLAILIFGIFLYITATISLEFEYRHGFHLAFASLALPLLAISLTLRGAVLFFRRLRRGEARRALVAPAKGLLRMLAFLITIALLLGIPLGGAWLWQRTHVGDLLLDYQAATLQPVQTQTIDYGDTVLFRVLEPVALPDPPPAHAAFRDAYLVAELDAAVTEVGLAYDRGTPGSEIAGDIPVTSFIPPHNRVRLFFPVYNIDKVDGFPWMQFSGIVLPKAMAAHFHGLYRVTNEQDFPLFLVAAVPEKPGDFQRCQQPGLTPVPPTHGRYRLVGALDIPIRQAENLHAQGKTAEAIQQLQSLLAMDPRNQNAVVALAQIHKATGGTQAAADTLRAFIGAGHEAIGVNAEYDDLLRQSPELQQAPPPPPIPAQPEHVELEAPVLEPPMPNTGTLSPAPPAPAAIPTGVSANG